MYKSRLYWGNIIFLVGAIPACFMITGISLDESAAQAGAVGLVILFILLPLIGLGALLSIAAVIKLTSIQKIQNAQLNNVTGTISLSIGWLILLFTVNVFGWFTYGYLST